MKKVVKNSILTATIAVAMMFFGGCNKDDTPALESGAFNGSVRIEISPASNVTQAWATVREGNDVTNLVSSTYSSGRFSFSLPKTLPKEVEKFLMDIDEFFEDYLEVSGKLKYSDTKAQILAVEFYGMRQQGTSYTAVEEYVYATKDEKNMCVFVYVDSDVNVTGGSNITVMLEKGWNRIYGTEEGKNNRVSTKVPKGDFEWLAYN